MYEGTPIHTGCGVMPRYKSPGPRQRQLGQTKALHDVLKDTSHNNTYLRAELLSTVMWYVGGLYGVHWDPKGYTGAPMTMGKGNIINMSRKHKLGVTSSTHAKVVSILGALG